MEFLHWLEQTSLSVWVRESPSPWAYAFVLLMHTIGMGLVVGISSGVALRILGFAPALRLEPMEKFFPILWAGFLINAVTGALLAMQDASTKLLNLDFYVKMVFIVLALTSQRMIRARVFGVSPIEEAPFSANTKVLAVTYLFCWLGAITSGRLLAYIGPIGGFGF